MRQFYKAFEKHNALRDELSWTHYRILLQIEKENARAFYFKKTIPGNWSTRQLEKQINSLYFDRLIMSNDKKRLMIDTGKLQQFILELGNGFSFVGRQYRITADNDHFYIDLVFYNYFLKCFLLIDLKTEKLPHQDIGHMDFYMWR
jgi:predicted nuclease of restriction endonuclease-like (RecB) superfamily